MFALIYNTDEVIPPVGAYDPNDGKLSGGVSFEKSERFKQASQSGMTNLFLQFYNWVTSPYYLFCGW